jgi:hypothetical protein
VEVADADEGAAWFITPLHSQNIYSGLSEEFISFAEKWTRESLSSILLIMIVLRLDQPSAADGFSRSGGHAG